MSTGPKWPNHLLRSSNPHNTTAYYCSYSSFQANNGPKISLSKRRGELNLSMCWCTSIVWIFNTQSLAVAVSWSFTRVKLIDWEGFRWALPLRILVLQRLTLYLDLLGCDSYKVNTIRLCFKALSDLVSAGSSPWNGKQQITACQKQNYKKQMVYIIFTTQCNVMIWLYSLNNDN